jgi:hypothetical protein
MIVHKELCVEIALPASCDVYKVDKLVTMKCYLLRLSDRTVKWLLRDRRVETAIMICGRSGLQTSKALIRLTEIETGFTRFCELIDGYFHPANQV